MRSSSNACASNGSGSLSGICPSHHTTRSSSLQCVSGRRGPSARAAIRYVERNPVRAGNVTRAEDYPWSSARGHCGMTADPLWALAVDESLVKNWSDWLAEDTNTDDERRLRDRTYTGRPCGDDD